MFVKGDIGEEGFVPCYAESKQYGIRAVDSVTFYPGDDSFHKMHHHGVAFESEEMAYRVYFDKRQTVDVYAKRTPRLELAESLWYPDDSLLAAGFGDDVLKVGNSIGVGTVRPYDYQQHRLVGMDRFISRTQRIVSLTRNKAVVEVETKGLQLEDTVADLRTHYIIRAGHRDVLCEVYSSCPLVTLVSGVQYIDQNNKSVCIKASGSGDDDRLVLAAWGTNWPVNDTVRYAKETVGLAVSVPSRYAGEAFSDSLQLLVPLRLEPQPGGGCYGRFGFTVVSQKEICPPAHDWEEFLQYLADWCPEY